MSGQTIPVYTHLLLGEDPTWSVMHGIATLEMAAAQIEATSE